VSAFTGAEKTARVLSLIPTLAFVMVIVILFWKHQYLMAWCFLGTLLLGIPLAWFSVRQHKRRMKASK
jgi:positive regulator of sigma E activity